MKKGVLGAQTRGGGMVGADTELWRHPNCQQILHFLDSLQYFITCVINNFEQLNVEEYLQKGHSILGPKF